MSKSGCGNISRETGWTSETGQTSWKPNLFTSHFSRLSRASRPWSMAAFGGILLLREGELGQLSLIKPLLHQRINVEHPFDFQNVIESGFRAGVRRSEE